MQLNAQLDPKLPAVTHRPEFVLQQTRAGLLLRGCSASQLGSHVQPAYWQHQHVRGKGDQTSPLELYLAVAKDEA